MVISSEYYSVLTNESSEQKKLYASKKRSFCWDQYHLDNNTLKSKRARKEENTMGGNKQKKCVTFSDTTESFFHVVIPDDLKESWYSREDYHNFKCDCYNTIQAIKRVHNGGANIISSLLDDNTYCIRGLESHASFLLYGVKSDIRRIVRKVVFFHACQRKRFCTFDPNSIKVLYSILSRQHRLKALQFAAVDSSEMV